MPGKDNPGNGAGSGKGGGGGEGGGEGGDSVHGSTTPAIPVNMPSLMKLPNEVLEKIFFFFNNVEDLISLGSTCQRLAKLAGQGRVWRVMLAKTQLVDVGQRILVDRVRTMFTFMDTLASHQIEQISELTVEEITCTTEEQGWTLVSFLERCSAWSVGKLHLNGYVGVQTWGRLAREVAPPCRGRLMKLYVGNISCSTEEEGLSIVSLLERCKDWVVQRLQLTGDVGENTWGRLAMEVIQLTPARMPGYAVRKGHLNNLDAAWEVVCRGRRVDMSEVYKHTVQGWTVIGCGLSKIDKFIKRKQRVGYLDDGFKEIVNMLIEANIPVFQNNYKTIVVTGQFDDIEWIYQYKYCPGKDGLKCGERVAQEHVGQTICINPNCRRKLFLEDLKDGYLLDMVVFANDGQIYTVRSSRDILEHLETGNGDTRAKLINLFNKYVTLKLKINANTNFKKEPMLESISVIPGCQQLFGELTLKTFKQY